MKSFKKSLIISFFVLAASVSQAEVYEPEVSVCDNLKVAYSKVLAAKDLVDRKNQYAVRINSLLESLENASIYNRCGFFKTVVASKRVAVDITDETINCPGPALLKGLVDASRRKLEPILTKKSESYRNAAHKKAVDLSAAIQKNMTSECK